MLFDVQRIIIKIKDAPNPYILKIFFYIAFNQPQTGIHGFQISKSQLQYDLKLGRTTFFESMRWLKENLLVHELKLLYQSDFMVNPYFMMNDGDKDARIKEWSRRLNLDSEREQRLKRQKRLRELRNSKNQ